MAFVNKRNNFLVFKRVLFTRKKSHFPNTVKMVNIYVFFSVLVFDYYLFIPLYLKVCFRQLLLKWCFADG